MNPAARKPEKARFVSRRRSSSAIIGSTSTARTATLISVPASAYLPDALAAQKLWGIAAQLYSLRSAHNWGIGDFTDLGTLLRATEQLGGATVAVNPLHELTLDNPTSASPYSPTSRLHLNGLYVDVDAAAQTLGKTEALRAAVDSAALEQLRRTSLVDYAALRNSNCTRCARCTRHSTEAPLSSAFAARVGGRSSISRSTRRSCTSVAARMRRYMAGSNGPRSLLNQDRLPSKSLFVHTRATSSFSRSCNGSRTSSSVLQRPRRICRSACIAISRSVSTSTAPRYGRTGMPIVSARPSALRPIQ